MRPSTWAEDVKTKNLDGIEAKNGRNDNILLREKNCHAFYSRQSHLLQ